MADEQIDWQVALTRIVHRRPTYRRNCRCPVPGILVASSVPKAIGKGRFTSGFVARLLVEKFVLGRPAHRIVAALAHDGLRLAEGTLAGVFAACSRLLAPLAEAISERNAAAGHASPRPATPTCCTRARRRSSRPWTANGPGWLATASSPSSPWTTTPASGRCADR